MRKPFIGYRITQMNPAEQHDARQEAARPREIDELVELITSTSPTMSSDCTSVSIPSGTWSQIRARATRIGKRDAS
jgi:hypothetical protein